MGPEVEKVENMFVSKFFDKTVQSYK